MKRILLGLLFGALIFGVSFAGAKVAAVTNPMSADLDANTHAIHNLSQLDTDLEQVRVVLQLGQTTGTPIAGSIGMGDGTTGTGVSVIAGQDDPTCKNFPPGSLYLRHATDGHGELWAHTLTDPCAGWAKVAG